MLQAIARLALAAPRWVLACALLVMVGMAIFGIPAAQHLSGGGFQDPASQSSQANRLLGEKFDRGDFDLIITVESPDGARGGTAKKVGTEIAEILGQSPHVASVTSAWTAPPPARAALLSTDGNTGLVIAGILGGERDAPGRAKALAEEVGKDRDGLTLRAGGSAMNYAQSIEQCLRDLLAMEAIAVPLTFVVLVWVFGGLLAAALPLAVSAFAMLGSLAVLRALTLMTDVSIFALNLTLAVGLALAVDYTLLIVSRYRDELGNGLDREEALRRTMAAAGRTVVFSAVTVALSMAALALFPIYFLKSFAYAGVATVCFAALGALLVTPALIVLLGERLDALDVRRLVRRILGRQEPAARQVEEMFWYRSTKMAMRHAVPVAVVVTAVLLILGVPFLSAKWGFPDDRVLPGSLSARQVGDTLRTEFAVDPVTQVTVVIPDVAAATPAELGGYAAELSRVSDVATVSAPNGTFIDGALAGPPTSPAGMADGSAFLTVTSDAELFSTASEAQLDAIHAVPVPGDGNVLVTGIAQINRDSTESITSRLTTALAIVAAITVVLVFLLTGSVVVAFKALFLNMLSLSAGFGALVWVFQEGHLGAFGTTSTGTLVAYIPLLLFCMAFGLSMDYEVFLISRIREYWLRSGRSAADNDESVALGLARTGRVVTAAALIMMISFAALLSAQVSSLRMLGLGLALAVMVDATLVRMLLMPSFMHLLGRRNWWSPRSLTRLHELVGLGETHDPAEVADLAAGSAGHRRGAVTR